jgi:hypothetical protein
LLEEKSKVELGIELSDTIIRPVLKNAPKTTPFGGETGAHTDE